MAVVSADLLPKRTSLRADAAIADAAAMSMSSMESRFIVPILQHIRMSAYFTPGTHAHRVRRSDKDNGATSPCRAMASGVREDDA